MTITLELPPETERKLRERAAAIGQDVTAFVQGIIERSVTVKPTLDEILAPFRQQVKESGMSDEELTTFFEDMRDRVWQEKHGGGR